MKLAIAQMNTKAGDFDATVGAMLAYGRRAQAAGADLLVYPMPALMGTDPAGLLSDEGYLLDVAGALGRLAEGLEVPALVPFCYNAGAEVPGLDVALLRDGGAVPLALAGWVRANGSALSAVAEGLSGDGGSEAHAAGSSAEDDDEAARALAALAGLPGASSAAPVVFDLDGTDVGVALTYEDLDAFAGGEVAADVVCYLPADGLNGDDEATALAPSISDGCFLADASDANAWLVAAGACGAYGDSVFCGGSFVLAPWGELAAVAPSFSEDLLLADIDVLSEGPLPEPVDAPAFLRPRMLWDACVLAVRDWVEKRGLAGAALVLDGTLASSALAAVAVDAVGPMRVSALVCAADEAARADARELARALRIRDVDELDAGALERACVSLGGDADAEALMTGLVETRLGATAAAGGLAVLSAADKTELAVGEGSPVRCEEAFAPFGDVYRSDLSRLARYRNTVSPVIPASSLARLRVPAGLGLEGLAATPELRLSELDAALLMHVERGCGLAPLAAGRLGAAAAGLVLERLAGRRARLSSGVAYPALSARTLREAAGAATDAWRDHPRDQEAEEPGADDVMEALREMSANPAGASEAGEAETAFPTDRVAEALGYLQELASGQLMQADVRTGSETAPKGEGPAGSDDEIPWPKGLFSDN